ncbi:MAG TPA: alpha/beta hydrolase [Myxococcota bacterium]|nr:alpha/beta hydrolase [Myxococcota bacterium]
MPRANANGIQIEYDSFGAKSGEPILLVMGLGGQMLLWDEEFCQRLADRGNYVVRYDNRDIGLSTHFDAHGAPNLPQLMLDVASGKPVSVAYTLDDMADDAAGLLDALELPRAHVVGASMGGMIAQTVAYRHPSRVASLTSIMSSTGAPNLPQAKPELIARLAGPPPVGRDATIDAGVETWKLISGTGYPFDEAMVRERTGVLYDRSHHPEGQARQLAAILAHGDRSPRLAAVRAPTLVIHGLDDPLVHPEGGRHTAAAIAGAQLLEIPGMGHDLPRPLFGKLVEAIASHVAKSRIR